jgi:GMP synthase (glutamine-hydrolysing)
MALAGSKDCRVQCMKAGLRSYGFQYHFEFTRAQIEAFTRDQTCQKEMAQAGLTPPDLLKQVEEHYDAFDRLATRLCMNIATFMFPAHQKLKV